MHALTPPRRAALLALGLTAGGCVDDSARARLDVTEHVECGQLGPIGPAGGVLCVDGHVLYIPPRALAGPTHVTLRPDDAPPIGAIDAPLDPLVTATIELEAGARFARPALWVAPVDPPDSSGTGPLGGDLLTPLRFGELTWARATLADGRHLPAITDATGNLGATLITAPGRYALAQPITDVNDSIPLEPGLDTQRRCHPLDIHHLPPDRVIAGESARPAIEALYDGPALTDPLVALIQSDRRAPGELAAALPADPIELDALADVLTASLDARLCVTETYQGPSAALLGAAAYLRGIRQTLDAPCALDRPAAIVLAGWALGHAATAALAAHPAAVDATSRLQISPDGRPSAEVDADLRRACADGRLTPDELSAVRWRLPLTYAARVADAAGVEVTDLIDGRAHPPVNRCRWLTLAGGGLRDGDPRVDADDALAVLAERAWLDHLLTELDRHHAFDALDAAALGALLDVTIADETPLLATLLRVMRTHGHPLAPGDLDARRRLDALDAAELPITRPAPACIPPPPLPDGDNPDDCAPRLIAPRDGVAPAPAFEWAPPADPDCLGGRAPLWRFACADSPDGLDGAAQPVADDTRDLGGSGCDTPGQWWWRVALIDRSGTPRWSRVRTYTLTPPDSDMCPPGVECAPLGAGRHRDCRPHDTPPCDQCRSGRCAPHDELDEDTLRAPLTGQQPDVAGGPRVELDCGADPRVYAPITGRLGVDGHRTCIIGDRLRVCLDGLTLAEGVRSSCRVGVGAELGQCAGATLSVEAYDPAGDRRPLAPPRLWPPAAPDGAPCCPTAEQCNGRDDDCDGVVDDLEPAACAAPCPDGRTVDGARICDAGALTCAPLGPCPPPPDTCDGAALWIAPEPGPGEALDLPPLVDGLDGATNDHAAPGCGALDGPDLYYVLEVPVSGVLTLTLAGDARLRVALRRLRDGAPDGCAAVGEVLGCGSALAGVEVEPGRYQVVVDRAGGGVAGAFTLRGTLRYRCTPGTQVTGPGGGADCATADGAAGTWRCDAAGRDHVCEPDLVPPDDAIPPIERCEDECCLEAGCEGIRDAEPDIEVDCPEGQTSIAGQCHVCTCQLARYVGAADLYDPGAVAGCEERRGWEANHVTMEIETPSEPASCASFPIIVLKADGDATFDPGQQMDAACTREPRQGEICARDNPNIAEMPAIEFRLKASESPRAQGATIVRLEHNQVEQAQLDFDHVDLTRWVADDDTIYLHVVRDACPAHDPNLELCQKADAQIVEGDCMTYPPPRDWFWSTWALIRSDCEPAP